MDDIVSRWRRRARRGRSRVRTAIARPLAAICAAGRNARLVGAEIGLAGRRGSLCRPAERDGVGIAVDPRLIAARGSVNSELNK